MAKSISLAVVQTPGEPGSAHLDDVGRLILEAADQGAQLVLLPELFAMPFHFDVSAWRWATPQGGEIEAFLRSTATMAGIHLGGSYLEARGLPPFSLAGKAGIARYRRELCDSPAGMARHHGIPVALANKYGPWHAPMPGWLPAVKSRFPGGSRIADSDGRELAVAADAVGVCCAEVTLAPERKRLSVPPEFDHNRPWITPPSLDYRLFPLQEWWGGHSYRRHPQRAAQAQERSHQHD